MVDIFGLDWRRQLQPEAEEGDFTNRQEEDAKELNLKLCKHVTEYIGRHVLNMEGADLNKLNPIVVAVYAIVLHPSWPLADVILRRLKKEDEVCLRSLTLFVCARSFACVHVRLGLFSCGSSVCVYARVVIVYSVPITSECTYSSVV